MWHGMRAREGGGEMAGLVVKDLMGGDFAVSLVSDDMWLQILKVPELIGEGPNYAWRFAEVVGWITAPEDADPGWRPSVDGCPEEREGFVCKTWYCQAPVIEPAKIVDNIDGIVFLPAY
jgi:hypothetical protein